MKEYNSYLEQWAYLKKEMGDLNYYYDKVNKMFNGRLWDAIEDEDSEEKVLMEFKQKVDWLEKAIERMRNSIDVKLGREILDSL